jgi:hypothetical protein
MPTEPNQTSPLPPEESWEFDDAIFDELFELVQEPLHFQPVSDVNTEDNNQDRNLPGYPSTSSFTTASTDSARSSNSLGFFANADVDVPETRKRTNPTPSDLTLEEKAEHRRNRNRDSAAEHRQRKKARIETLEAQVEALKEQVQQLETQNQALIADNTELTEQSRLSHPSLR